MPTMSRPALDVKGGTSPVKEDANQELSSLAYSNLGMKDRKAVAILHYPGVAANGTKASGAPTSSSGSPSPIGSPTATPPSKAPPFNLHPAPHLLASMQLQKLNSQLGPRGGGAGPLSPPASAQSPAIIDSDPVDEEVLMSLVVELGLDRASGYCSAWYRGGHYSNFSYCWISDVISIDKTGENFRLIYDTKGRFAVHRITPEEAKYKLCKVRKIFVGTKGIPHLVTHDARTIRYPDPLIKVNDTIQIDLETGKITDFIKFDTGNLCMVTGGANLGRIGVITNRERHPGSFDVVHVKDANGNSFATRLSNIFVIGKGNKPWISLPRGKGIRLTIAGVLPHHCRRERQETGSQTEQWVKWSLDFLLERSSYLIKDDIA
ncbi:40S ribosomal protein S4 [Tupaia chinensis]|uniref:40S ribosomal protein S4 n=1 Tax=Tupaia chinensis TaxID=246437 RepID=L8Y433_TUPCH|nr:40S ribosomal protein S4 [Tupaia chinensis]